jgi:hypothetical protein
MSHATSQPHRAVPTEMRVLVAPGGTLQAERRDGEPAAVPFVLAQGLVSSRRF